MSRQVPAKNGGTLTRPDKGETMNPNGRPPRLVSTIIKELKAKGIEPVKPAQVLDAFQQLLNLNIKELTDVANNDENPYFVRRIASEMTSKGKGYEVIERMINRAHGMPRQSTDITSGGKEIAGLNITVADKETGDVLRKLLENGDKLKEKEE
jgi:hypothetical protein